MFSRTIASAALVASVAACAIDGTGRPQSTVLPARAMAVPPTYEYRRWWSAIERCSGLHRAIDSVTFVVVGSPWMLALGNRPAFYRAAFAPPDSLLIGLYATQDSAVLMHEMLHALRPGRDGDANDGHPRQDFHGACAPLIAHGAEDDEPRRSPQ